MTNQLSAWTSWARFFAARSKRELPSLDANGDYGALPASLARSLAIFQLGESGGGTVVRQSLRSSLPGIDEYFAAAVLLFVEEEHRHANILAMCVRQLGGKLRRNNWTQKLFVIARRLMGLRLKFTVLLAAEVVGICYYHLIAMQLPASRMRDQLLEIVEDERAHLYFHCDFLHSQVRENWQRRLFKLTWRTVMACASVAVIIDHSRAMRDLGITLAEVTGRWRAYSHLAEALVTLDGGKHLTLRSTTYRA